MIKRRLSSVNWFAPFASVQNSGREDEKFVLFILGFNVLMTVLSIVKKQL